ncbi:ATP-binding cassette domain-containing protein [Leptospira sp. 2 VSF19]|uniref:ATP-binding cassette domain-containing protein n=1 Tax=Leptospira soteropolitanensis TaxID=2950025 RepID=A0AAW5V917_9LEPT|nr:oligopeptide/dipeptide ABC transporter ATP-binding protein [Leptospira soteropolitanensis]MCW7491865.1 ATP-binding cassette domain-containing protein [Leptospira soteropolitanensis]MCW7499449.1 ATP-binding cassette domain-containing protein [Leptospira soteropolitanensis]MCW7520960.1 ATP-binding cassette domain-containing protein [Leptospira soteropolitanensis]MCW7525553.1 ATP-binding cassette domain-containing protein [Leptospira soteropolitanensis]MCW7529419.1 ATP-binding cassette domain-
MLNVKDLVVSYKQSQSLSFSTKRLVAVEGVSFTIPEGKILGLVGESGCGKSTIGRAILSLLPFDSGSIQFENQEIKNIPKEKLKALKRKIQVVFQDPYSSLNPRFTIEEILTEGLQIHFSNLTASEKKEKAVKALAEVNLPADILHRYPHEFSGGQRQRIAIARALILEPSLVVCDEAVSALDISTQAQVINNILLLREKFGLSYLFISHDLNIVKHVSDRIAVMYLGQIVEECSRDEISQKPLHPYTKALFSASFDLKDRTKISHPLVGEIPSLMNKPRGCRFHTRCPIVQDICKMEEPVETFPTPTRRVKCHFPLL